jgi:autoinducer 2-degrading protein
MYIALVRVHVKPDRVEDFKALIRPNHVGSISEPGCLRFDVAQSAEDPTRFVLWECYRDEAAAREHKTTPHYLAFKAGAAELMADERVSELYAGLYPEPPVLG